MSDHELMNKAQNVVETEVTTEEALSFIRKLQYYFQQEENSDVTISNLQKLQLKDEEIYLEWTLSYIGLNTSVPSGPL